MPTPTERPQVPDRAPYSQQGHFFLGGGAPALEAVEGAPALEAVEGAGALEADPPWPPELPVKRHVKLST